MSPLNHPKQPNNPSDVAHKMLQQPGIHLHVTFSLSSASSPAPRDTAALRSDPPWSLVTCSQHHMGAAEPRSLGQHIASRLAQIGVEEFFGVSEAVASSQSKSPAAAASYLRGHST